VGIFHMTTSDDMLWRAIQGYGLRHKIGRVFRRLADKIDPPMFSYKFKQGEFRKFGLIHNFKLDPDVIRKQDNDDAC
jgi:hypothetical protein